MDTHMKTTIEISDPLLKAAKKAAARNGISSQALVELGLRNVLETSMTDAPFTLSAYDQISSLAEGRSTWAIPWPCLHEFFSIVTHPKIYKTPTPQLGAIQQIDAWLESPSATIIGETTGYWEGLRSLLLVGKIIGPRVNDARIAAICKQHGVRELWSADRDFNRFGSLVTRNPLTDH